MLKAIEAIQKIQRQNIGSALYCITIYCMTELLFCLVLVQKLIMRFVPRAPFIR